MENNAANHVVWAIIIGAIIIAGAILYKSDGRYQFAPSAPPGALWIIDTQTGEIYAGTCGGPFKNRNGN